MAKYQTRKTDETEDAATTAMMMIPSQPNAVGCVRRSLRLDSLKANGMKKERDSTRDIERRRRRRRRKKKLVDVFNIVLSAHVRTRTIENGNKRKR